MENWEIAGYEQFLLFPQCFQKTCTADTKTQGSFGKDLKDYTDCIESIVEEGEIAHFSPQCFPKGFFFNVLKWVHMEERVYSTNKRLEMSTEIIWANMYNTGS